MKPNTISVLVSDVHHFTIAEIDKSLETFQKLVGGYIEMVPRPASDSGWVAYCNEDGKSVGLPVNTMSNLFLNKLYAAEGARPFTSYDEVVGSIIWMTDSISEPDEVATLPIEYIIRFTNCAVREQPGLITLLRDGFEVWVLDQAKDSLIPQQVAERVRAARSRETHGTIEVWPDITPPTLVELLGEFKIAFPLIRIHDERAS